MSQLPEVTPALADEVLKLDFANVLRKVQAGRTLTNAERQLVAARRGADAVPVATGAVTNKSELARRLGISRQLLNKYHRLDGFPTPNEDGSWNVEACREWCRQHGKPLDPDGAAEEAEADTDGLPSMANSEKRYEAAKADIEEMKAARMRGELVEIETVHRVWDDIVAAAKRHLTVLPTKLESQFVPGMTAQDVRALAEREIDEALQELSRPLVYADEPEAEESDDDQPEEETDP